MIDLTRRRLLALSGNAAALGMLGGCESFPVASPAQPGLRHQRGRRASNSARRGRAAGGRVATPASGALRRHRAPHLRLLLGHRQSGQRPGARPLSDAVAGEHRRGRLGAHGLSDRRRARLHHARAGARSARSPRCASCAMRRKGRRRVGMTGLQGLLLPLPRHEDRRSAPSDSELSTVDTALLLAGVLLARPTSMPTIPDEVGDPRAWSTRSTGASTGTGRRRGAPAISMGWKPGDGFIPYDWRGYNEAMLVYLLALGSPTHPVGAEAWTAWTSSYDASLGHASWARAPELRAALRPPVLARVDRFPRHPGRVHARARPRLLREHAAAPPTRSGPTRSPIRKGCKDYGANVWGLTACDGPGKMYLDRPHGPARATSSTTRRAAPAAGRRSTTARSRRPPPSRRLPFAPEIVDPGRPRRCTRATASTSTRSTASSMRSTAASSLPTSRCADGRVDPGVRLGRQRLSRHRPGPDPGDDRELSQRARLGRRCASARTLRRGLERAGFTGGWLDQDA